MKSTLIRLGLVASLGLTSALSLTACTDSEVALGAGVIIGAIVADDGDHHHHHHGGYHRPPPRRHDGWGRGRGHRWAADFQLAAAVETDTMKTAYHFDIPTDAAQKVIEALKAAEQKDFSKVAALGLTHADLKAMAAGENPSVSGLRAMSQALDLDLAETHNVIQQMKADLEAAR